MKAFVIAALLAALPVAAEAQEGDFYAGVLLGTGHGERIYHVPGQRYYDVTVIETHKGERWFCSEQEARAADGRRPGVRGDHGVVAPRRLHAPLPSSLT